MKSIEQIYLTEIASNKRLFLFRDYKKRFWNKDIGNWDAPIIVKYECDDNIPLEICSLEADKKLAEFLKIDVNQIIKNGFPPKITLEIKHIKA